MVKICVPLLLVISTPCHAQSVTDSISTLLQSNSCPRCNLAGADLGGGKLMGADLEAAHLINANLRQADLTHLDIDTVLEWLEITGTQLEGRFKNGVTC